MRTSFNRRQPYWSSIRMCFHALAFFTLCSFIQVWITPWPTSGSRPLAPGSGTHGGVRAGSFEYRWRGDLLEAINNAVPDGNYVTGRLPSDVSAANRTHVLTREANYHPDGGQVFFPSRGQAFVLLLAAPGDDIKPEDFVAFYFDGSRGFQIKAGLCLH